MNYYDGSGNGRHVVLNLGKGEKILESIEQCCRELGIADAMIVGAIGSARKMIYHRIESTADDPVNKYLTIDQPCEIGAIQGMVLDGQAHLHVAFSDKEHSYNGHMEPGCEVQYLLEVGLVEMPGLKLRRSLDEFGIQYIAKR